MDGNGTSLRKFLENWLQMLLWLEFLILKRNDLGRDSRCFLRLELICLVSLYIVFVDELVLIVFVQKFNCSGAISLVLSTWMSGNSDYSNTIKGSE